MCAIPDAVLYGRCGNDEDSAALFKVESVEFDDNDDIENCKIPIHLHPPVSAAESGNLDALRQAVVKFDLERDYVLHHLLGGGLDHWINSMGLSIVQHSRIAW